MRFYFGPGNNSLSHILKCLSIMDILSSRGHEVFIAIGQKYSGFLKKLGTPYFILPDIQETDDSGFPSFKWFSNPKYVLECIKKETELLRRLNPDRALGVFNFTLQISAGIAGIPYDSLICGCMLKESKDILGFHGDEPEKEIQKVNIQTFFNYATQKMNRALGEISKIKINDIRDLLKGDMTFLWDFPEFMPLPLTHNFLYLGPISYHNKNCQSMDTDEFFYTKNPLVVISFGTCSGDKDVLVRLTKICLESGFAVFIAAGGQKAFLSLFQAEPRVKTSLFTDLIPILRRACLLITHGGQITVFEALKAKVPVLVMPFQPEQAHNGICLERIGCGELLIPPKPFRTGSRVYIDAFNGIKDNEIADRIRNLSKDPQTAENLLKIRHTLEKR
ncbi:MAG: glycosyl transferase, partial [Proteobacteria bacterium]|nr:glycosyl transferase [Pseudomonadota bacterium]